MAKSESEAKGCGCFSVQSALDHHGVLLEGFSVYVLSKCRGAKNLSLGRVSVRTDDLGRALPSNCGRHAHHFHHIGRGVVIAAIVVDSVRLGRAVADDYNSQRSLPSKTIKAGAAIGGGWAGSAAGALVGRTIGNALEESGCTHGAAFVTVLGGVVGAVGGSIVAQKLADKLVA